MEAVQSSHPMTGPTFISSGEGGYELTGTIINMIRFTSAVIRVLKNITRGEVFQDPESKYNIKGLT